MRSASSSFNPYESHRVAARATLLPSGLSVPITEGSVTIDSASAVRSSGDFTIVDDGTLGLIPTKTSDVLAPYGNEVQISRGIEYDDGTVELIPLAVLRIESSTTASAGGELNVRVSGLDRAQPLSEAKFESAYEIDDGTNIVTALETLLAFIEPDYDWDMGVATTFTVPKIVAAEGDDPWDFALKFAQAFGMELYFDAEGVPVLRPVASSGAVAVAQIHENRNLLDISLDWTREAAYNRVIATGQNATGTGAIPRFVATDADANSPTRYDGDFGRKPLFYESEFITDDEQAQAAAEAVLAKNLGTAQRISFQSLVDPRLEPGDTVEITREKIGVVQETHILDSLQIPLDSESGMSGATRLSRVIGS